MFWCKLLLELLLTTEDLKYNTPLCMQTAVV